MTNILNQTHNVSDKSVFHEAQSDLVALNYDRMEMSVRVSFVLKSFKFRQIVQGAVNEVVRDAQPNELGVFEEFLTVPMTNDLMVDIYIQDESTTHSYPVTESPGLVNQYRLRIGIDDIDTVKDEYVLYRSIMLPAGFDSNDHKVVMEGNGFKHSGHHYHDICYILTNAQDELIISQTYHPNGSYNGDEDRLMRLLKEEMIENESYTLHVEYLIDDLVFVSYPASNLAVDPFGLRYEAIDTYYMRVTPITPSY